MYVYTYYSYDVSIAGNVIELLSMYTCILQTMFASLAT